MVVRSFVASGRLILLLGVLIATPVSIDVRDVGAWAVWLNPAEADLADWLRRASALTIPLVDRIREALSDRSLATYAPLAGTAFALVGWSVAQSLPRRRTAAPAHSPSRSASAALAACRPAFWSIAAFSAVINVLALTGSIYMLQVYDRVITSRSVPTLIGLTILMVGLYGFNGLLELLRTRITSRIGLRFDRLLRAQVYRAMMLVPLRAAGRGENHQPVRDLDQVRSFLASTGPAALFDLPWMPMYLGLVYLLHVWLGVMATAGAALLVGLTLLTEARSRAPTRTAAASAGKLATLTEASRRNAEVVRAMGMEPHLCAAFEAASARHLTDQVRAQDVVATIGAVTKVVRIVLQSGMLGLGAYLTISGDATGGVMIASSILTSRALAPVEIAIANWRGFVGARQSYGRLKALLATTNDPESPMELPPPKASLTVEGLSLAAPGRTTPILRNVSFALDAGQGLGIIGPSASGKSTLARGLAGIWQAQGQGCIRIDQASLDQWPAGRLGASVGYLPQDVELFDGTVAQNIARFDPAASSDAILEAARAAGVHDLVFRLAQGFNTPIGTDGHTLSAGQCQRIGLARALYGNPFLVILDEPNSNLDAEGEAALTAAIAGVRARGGIAVVVAHRPSVLAAVDHLLVLANGQVQAFGPKEKVLTTLAQSGVAGTGRETAPPPPARSQRPYGQTPWAEGIRMPQPDPSRLGAVLNTAETRL
jgi:ATP-binding cassette subfamily C protein